MKVILENKSAEILEKKSRFIANIFYVESETLAEERITEIRKKYYDAKHNCFAYVIGVNGEVVKSSDDGEPQGTAGHPMLDLLNGNNITNCIAIVTRYFGGTLLGTGGLVRAYSDSLKEAIKKTSFAEIGFAYEVSFSINYDDYGKVEKLIQSYNDIYSLDKTFEDVVKLKYLVNDTVFDRVAHDIENVLKGKVVLNRDIKKTYYYNNEIKYIN